MRVILTLFLGIVRFNVLFKDKLLTKAVETGLGSVFQADAEVKGLSLSVLKWNVSFSSLKIADKNSPYTNLPS